MTEHEKLPQAKHTQPGSLAAMQWVEQSDIPPPVINTLCAELDIHPGTAQVLAGRGYQDAQSAHDFLHPGPSGLHSPFLLKGVREAVQRIIRAIEQYEKILIFGDYDVDGTSGTTLLFGFLKRLGARVQYFIPNRVDDGYGFTEEALAKIRAWDVDLLITVDHGSTAHGAAEALGRMGVELIITDHHQFDTQVPQALALVNPVQPGCPYPFKELSATGVVYKLVTALDATLDEMGYYRTRGLRRTEPEYFLDLVAMATVADMSPLVGENRVLVRMGLEVLNTHLKPGLSGLVKESRVRGPITPSVIAFKLAPKINALGRIDDPRMAMKLLLSRSYTEGRRLARRMADINRERQVIEREAFNRAQEQVAGMDGHAGLVLVGHDWHPGVVGPIATRIAYASGRPTVVLTPQPVDAMGGSARSQGVSVLGMLDDCAGLLERYGGHPNACGLSMPAGNLADFTRHFRDVAERHAGSAEDVPRELRIEAWVPPQALNGSLLNELLRLAPFGYGNPEPVLAVRGLAVNGPTIFKSRHLRFHVVSHDGGEMEAYAWNHSEWELRCTQDYDIAFVPQIPPSHHMPPQIRVLDIKQSA